MIKKIGLIGASGFVGNALQKAILLVPDQYSLTPISRENFQAEKQNHFDILIHSAMPSKRWWAANHPLADFDATVRLTAEILYQYHFEKLALISSVSARLQTDHPYGRHKHAAEILTIDHNKENVVFRLGGLYGEGLDKGVVFDMMHGNEVFMTADSSFNYIDTYKAAQLIVKYIEATGIKDIGAKNVVSIGEIAQKFQWKVQFGKRHEFQNTEYPESDFPDAQEIFNYIETLKVK